MKQFSDLSYQTRSKVVYKLRELESRPTRFPSAKWHRQQGALYALHQYVVGTYDVHARRANMKVTLRDAKAAVK